MLAAGPLAPERRVPWYSLSPGCGRISQAVLEETTIPLVVIDAMADPETTLARVTDVWLLSTMHDSRPRPQLARKQTERRRAPLEGS